MSNYHLKPIISLSSLTYLSALLLAFILPSNKILSSKSVSFLTNGDINGNDL